MAEQPLGEENGAGAGPAETAPVSDAFGLMGMEQPKANDETIEETKEEDFSNAVQGDQDLLAADGEGHPVEADFINPTEE